MPWGIDVDAEGAVYVADWRNDRIQKFSPDGGFLAEFGSSGSGVGQFREVLQLIVSSREYQLA